MVPVVALTSLVLTGPFLITQLDGITDKAPARATIDHFNRAVNKSEPTDPAFPEPSAEAAQDTAHLTASATQTAVLPSTQTARVRRPEALSPTREEIQPSVPGTVGKN